MHPNRQQPKKLIQRRTVYGLAFLLLCAMALSGVWFSDDVLAENAQPVGNTIPPGGTVPPAPEPLPNQGQVNIIHVAPFASELIDTGIQICDVYGLSVTNYLYYQQESGYLNLPFGTYDWYVAEAGSSCGAPLPGLDMPPFFVADGTRLAIVIFGDIVNQPLDSMVLIERFGEARYLLPLMYTD